MIAVDTNVLIHAHREESPRHEHAVARLRELAEGRSRWGIPSVVLAEFLRIITHPRVFDPPHTLAEATEALRRVLASPSVMVLNPEDGFAELLCEAVLEADAGGNLVFDAQVVALCRQHGVSRLLTQDRDFDRFSGLEVERLE
jgi:toxin-antitoxin system PIN domain toxin